MSVDSEGPIDITSACSHNLPAKSISTFECLLVQPDDVREFRRKLFESDDKIKQDSHVLLHISVDSVKRAGSRRKRIRKSFDRKFSANYSIHAQNRKYRVCKNFFLKMIKPINVNRLRGIVSRFRSTGSIPKENRGGDRCGTKNNERKKAVRNFIGKLRAKESHYGRNKSIRLYLSSSLKSVRNLRKIYNISTEPRLRVGYNMFFRIFVRDFNIGFCSPATDTCTTCDKLRNEIRYCAPNEKAQLIMQLRVHKLRSKAFYTQLKKKSADTYSVVYDLQQVHSLPKVSCQEAFYSRQLSLYNFGLCDQTSGNNFSYTWTENQSGRGANEISSAVHHYLTSVIKWDSNDPHVANVTKIRLVSDGCGGQNKNNIVLGMAMGWLVNAPKQINTVEMLFPVRGHSFLPCDRLFGRIEKELKSKDSILNPKGFHDVFGNHCANVFRCAVDWNVVDWKEGTSSIYKPLPHIQEAKRVVIERVEGANDSTSILVRCESNYNSNVAKAVNLLKRGKKHANLKLNVVPGFNERPISAPKLKDIHNLLKVSFGLNWKKIPGTDIYRELKSAPGVKDDLPPDKNCECGDVESSCLV